MQLSNFTLKKVILWEYWPLELLNIKLGFKIIQLPVFVFYFTVFQTKFSS